MQNFSLSNDCLQGCLIDMPLELSNWQILAVKVMSGDQLKLWMVTRPKPCPEMESTMFLESFVFVIYAPLPVSSPAAQSDGAW